MLSPPAFVGRRVGQHSPSHDGNHIGPHEGAVLDTGAEALVDKDVVNHVARSRTITISEPSSAME